MRLINTRSLEIARRESRNIDRMCLYGAGGYWTGFERSAYFLCRIFPQLESFVVKHPEHPDSIIGVSVSDRELKRLSRNAKLSHSGMDYLEFLAEPIESSAYLRWHDTKVHGLLALAE